MDSNQQAPAVATTLPVNPMPPPVVKTGKSKHLILILLIVFPPLAWYYMWKEDKYHNWFASVLIVDGLIFLATSFLLLTAFYPPITQVFTSLKLEQPQTAKTMPYIFIAIGIIEVIFGLYLRIKTHHLPSLSKRILVPVLILLTIHFIGLPLGQALSYVDLITNLYTKNLNYYNTLPQPRQPVTPQPTIDPSTDWKTYTTSDLSFKYPPTWKVEMEPNGYDLVRFRISKSAVFGISYLEVAYDKYTPTTAAKPTKKIKVDGKDAVVFELNGTGDVLPQGFSIISIIVSRNVKSSYDITFNGSRQDINDALINQVLLTIKFLDQNTPIPTISKSEEEQVACTMEAKLCPDGSSVGRSGPNCEFTPCPN